ncbi:MAG: response regulator transcription factor [Pseudoclavibacter sp.]|nr:response regulator transcription factor [Pseudoclavibacter sp.]
MNARDRSGPGGPIRLLLVDDQQLLRRGLRMLLSTVPGMEVVGEAADGREALAVMRRVEADVVLCDLRMPVMDGVRLVAEARERFPGVPVLVLTTFDDDELVRSALDAGAAGFLLKSVSTDALAEAIRQVRAGGLVLDPAIAGAVLRRTRPGSGAEAGPADPFASLTPAEAQVARLVATGATNREIAAGLHLAVGTVKNHVSAILRKLGSRDRISLALLLHDALAARGED